VLGEQISRNAKEVVFWETQTSDRRPYDFNINRFQDKEITIMLLTMQAFHNRLFMECERFPGTTLCNAGLGCVGRYAGNPHRLRRD
jgi:hypothetical protein